METTIRQKIDNFFKIYEKRHHDKGYILVYAGQQPPGVFQLLSGEVREYDITPAGDEVVVNVFKPPAFFPMSWAINGTPNQYFFDAVTSVSLKMAPADKTVAFLKANPDVIFDLLSRTYRGTDGLLRRMAHLMASTARTRLLFELMVLAKRSGQAQKGGGAQINISESDLAKRAGLSRETVSRQLTALGDLVTIDRKGLHISSLEELETQLGSSL